MSATDKELDELEARLREHARKGMAQPRNFPPYYREADEKRAADAIAELRKKNAELEGALEAIAAISAAPPSSDTGARLYAALDALDDARSLARTALKGKETP